MERKILVVDDSESLRGLTSMTLSSNGYSVVEAADGLDGFEKLKSNKMPKMNGIEMILKIKEIPEYKFIPVVMITTEGEEEKKELGRQAGVKAWITKPVKSDTLISVVKKILG